LGRREAGDGRSTDEDRQAFLLELSDALRPLGDPVAMQEAATGLLGRRLGVSRAFYAEFIVKGDREYVVVEREHLAPGATSFVGRHPTERFGPDLTEFRAGHAISVSDTAAEVGTNEQRSVWRALDVRARLGVPPVKDGRLVAGLGVDDTAPREWTPAELELVRETAERTWAALERAHAQAALRDSEERQRFLLELGDRTRGLADPETIIAVASRALGERLGAARLVYADIDEAKDRAFIHGQWIDAIAPGMPAEVRLSDFGAPLIVRLRSGGTVRVEDARLDTRTESSAAALDAIGVRAIVSVPLFKDARFVVNLNVHHSTPDVWTDAEVELIEAVAERTWEAVERARAEATLRASEELNRRILASSADCIKVLGLDGSLELMSEGGARTLGYDEANAPPLGASWPGMFEPDGRAAAADAVVCAAAGETARFEASVTTLSGDVLRWDSVMTPILGADGRPEKILALSRDVTAQRTAEAALREGEARLSAIFARAKVGLSDMALDGRFVRVNDELCAILGRSCEELMSAGVPDVTHPDDVALSLANFGRTLETGSPVSFDKRYLRPDGSVIWANSSLTRLDDDRGEPRSILAVTVDLTDRQAQAAALREETRTLETLNRTGAQLAGELDLDRLLQTVTAGSVELTGAKFGAYFHNVMDETGERLHLFTLSGAEREAFLAMGRPRATAIFGPTFRNETVIRSDDILADPATGGTPRTRACRRGTFLCGAILPSRLSHVPAKCSAG
jgi:PAS domain S-box-containing protein